MGGNALSTEAVKQLERALRALLSIDPISTKPS